MKPVVFVSHMEHHSNQTSWLETIADVVVIPCDDAGLICFKSFERLIKENEHRKLKIASVTACSNVTGIKTDYHKIAKIIHAHNGLCFVDFACSAPYVDIDMHPEEEDAYLDAIFFSPHKFLGGPGTSGVLIFNKKLYKNVVPDNPGGGTVSYTNPWGDHDYFDDVETREDGGTPAFMQTIKIALCVQLKEKMGTDKIHDREEEINAKLFSCLESIDNVNILAPNHKHRLGIFSFYVDDVHFNLIVKLLNDRFGIQTRGGCSCAGTYGHFLLNVDQQTSKAIEIAGLDQGEIQSKDDSEADAKAAEMEAIYGSSAGTAADPNLSFAPPPQYQAEAISQGSSQAALEAASLFGMEQTPVSSSAVTIDALANSSRRRPVCR